jgi:hypothetical protein
VISAFSALNSGPEHAAMTATQRNAEITQRNAEKIKEGHTKMRALITPSV